jgi:hypothetical protein
LDCKVTVFQRDTETLLDFFLFFWHFSFLKPCKLALFLHKSLLSSFLVLPHGLSFAYGAMDMILLSVCGKIWGTFIGMPSNTLSDAFYDGKGCLFTA